MPDTYKPLSIAVTNTFRSLVLSTYPALKEHDNAAVYMRIMQYVLFSTFVDERTGSIIVPYKTIAALVGMNPHNHRFKALTWLEDFNRDVLLLNTEEYVYSQGWARTITPQIALEIMAAKRLDSTNDEPGEVWFLDGSLVSRRGLQAQRREYEEYLRSLSVAMTEKHPAYPLMQYLLGQPPDTLKKVLKQNWPAVKDAVKAMPAGTAEEQGTRNWCERVLVNLNMFQGIYYTGSDKTPRIFSVGATVHLLPRGLRKLAFTGQVECDLRACQLAVVARLWDIEPLQTFLKSGANIWDELLSWVGMPPVFKGIIKRTVYSIVFGMGRRNLLKQLAEGDFQSAGIGKLNAQKFFKHSLIQSLLEARGRQQQVVDSNNGCKDAWGIWLDASHDYETRRKNLPSVLACVVQSYELRIMLSILPVLKSNPQIYLLSWLHDGVTLHFGNISKRERQLVQLKRAIQVEAESLGMETWLEVES